MSKGPGRIERAIAAILDGEADNAFTTEDLCERVYSGVNRVEKKHRVAVLRAANKLVKRRDNTGCWRSENLGGTRVYFNIDNVMSYAMARLKADNLNHYRSNDDRWFTPTAEMVPGGDGLREGLRLPVAPQQRGRAARRIGRRRAEPQARRSWRGLVEAHPVGHRRDGGQTCRRYQAPRRN